MRAVIIGNGIAGVTAGLELRRRNRDWQITVISGESLDFYSRPALMYIYMGHMRLEDTRPYAAGFWEKKRIERIRAWVTGVDTDRQEVELDGHPAVAYDTLLVATGSQSNKFGWPGQDLDRVQGLYGLSDLESLERHSPDVRRAVIVGGGLIGIELAEMLHSRGVAVTMLARESEYWNNALPDAEAHMVQRHILAHGIDLRLSTELGSIEGDAQGRARAVVTGEGDRIECELVGLTAGVRPNLSAVQGSKIATGRGVLVDDSLRTNIENVYAAGDCAELVTPEGERNLVEQLWYTGKMQGEVAAAVMSGEARTHARGIWFNSAKFLDLEWHTYGQVTPGQRPVPDGERHAWWESADGGTGLRIVARDGAVIGMNALGLRHRHRVWEGWIAERRSPDYVLDHLRDANFDPELYRRFESEITPRLREQFA